MFAALQIPLLDARPYLTVETRQLLVPAWPIPRPNVDFVRQFGVVRRRLRGGIEDWQGEELYCDARHAARLPHARNKILLGDENHAATQFAFRRLMRGGESLARVEFGFKIETNRWFIRDFDELHFLSLLKGLLKLDVQVGTGPSASRRALIESSQPFACLYLKSSTRKSNGEKPDAWWVTHGEPTLLLEYDQSEVKSLPEHARQMTHPAITAANIHLSHMRLSLSGREISCWLVGKPLLLQAQSPAYEVLRKLRMNIFRLHAEIEGMKQVFRLVREKKIAVQPGTEASERLQQFLKKSMEVLTRKTRDGLPQGDLLDVALTGRNLVESSEIPVIQQQLEGIRTNLLRNITKALGQSLPEPGQANILYDLTKTTEATLLTIIDNRVMNTTNITMRDNSGVVAPVTGGTLQGDITVNNYYQTPEFKKDLETLSEELKKVQLSHSNAPVQSVEQKVQELSKGPPIDDPLPPQKWYEIRASGLLEAVQALGKIATPATTIALKLFKMLGGAP